MHFEDRAAGNGSGHLVLSELYKMVMDAVTEYGKHKDEEAARS